MKKKILSLMVSLSMILLLVACGNNATSSAPSTGGSGETFELALVTDLETIDDKSFNQGAWEGLKKYAE